MTARAWPPRGTFEPRQRPTSRRRSRPQWWDKARCAETDPEVFFPEQGEPNEDAKQICRGCEVRAECLAWALRNHIEFGVWGGLSETERRPGRRAGQVAA